MKTHKKIINKKIAQLAFTSEVPQMAGIEIVFSRINMADDKPLFCIDDTYQALAFIDTNAPVYGYTITDAKKLAEKIFGHIANRIRRKNYARGEK